VAADVIANTIVSTDWLAAHLDAPDIRIVDASWYLPTDNRDPKKEYHERHIPGAVFFDIDEIADTDSDLPHMLPSAEKFSARVRKLGLGDGNRIVVYDGGGVAAACRAWWMFKVFGHEDVVVLDGGLNKWLREGRPVDDLPPMPQERHFTARLNSLMVRDKGQIMRYVETRREQVVDARSAERFAGKAPEPRPNVRPGHIPGSHNLPFGKLFDPETGTFLPPDKIEAAFHEAGIDTKSPVVTTCGSGVTACVLFLGLHMLGHRKLAVYDGSWSEWGRAPDTPVAIG
jgi:thiosulfate/3-mercaptopyruvate sulfurtransferase